MFTARTTVALSLMLLAGCPTEEADTPSSGPSDPASGETGAPADPDAPAPKPAAEPDPAAESCEDQLARAEADLAACLAK